MYETSSFHRGLSPFGNELPLSSLTVGGRLRIVPHTDECVRRIGAYLWGFKGHKVQEGDATGVAAKPAFEISGLSANEIEAKVMAECSNGSDFIRTVMNEIASKQGVNRWIDSTPTNIPHMLRISRDFPEARFIHIIRDGRDVALSLEKRSWSRPLPWDKKRSLLAAGIYWEWIVRKGRKYGAMLGPKYMEVRYEELVEHPGPPLRRIGNFLQHELDYDRIRGAPLGLVDGRLTSFTEDLKDGHFTPVGRWKYKFPEDQLLQFEKLVGRYLVELGYPLSHSMNDSEKSFGVRKMRWVYINFYDFKQWAKVNTPLSRWIVSYSNTLLDK